MSPSPGRALTLLWDDKASLVVAKGLAKSCGGDEVRGAARARAGARARCVACVRLRAAVTGVHQARVRAQVRACVRAQVHARARARRL